MWSPCPPTGRENAELSVRTVTLTLLKPRESQDTGGRPCAQIPLCPILTGNHGKRQLGSDSRVARLQMPF